jgi:hypothetical protein
MAGSQILIQDNSISSKKFNAQLTGLHVYAPLQ